MASPILIGRQSGSQSVGAGTIQATLPVGSQAGDMCIAHFGGDTYYGPGSATTPSGWTVVEPFAQIYSGLWLSQSVWAKELTNADIALGYLQTTISTYYGAFPLGSNNTIAWLHLETWRVGAMPTGAQTISFTAADHPVTPVPDPTVGTDSIVFCYGTRRGVVPTFATDWVGYNANLAITPTLGYTTMSTAGPHRTGNLTIPSVSTSTVGIFTTFRMAYEPDWGLCETGIGVIEADTPVSGVELEVIDDSLVDGAGVHYVEFIWPNGTRTGPVSLSSGPWALGNLSAGQRITYYVYRSGWDDDHRPPIAGSATLQATGSLGTLGTVVVRCSGYIVGWHLAARANGVGGWTHKHRIHRPPSNFLKAG